MNANTDQSQSRPHGLGGRFESPTTESQKDHPLQQPSAARPAWGTPLKQPIPHLRQVRALLVCALALCAGALPAAQSIIPFTAKLTDSQGRVIDGQRTITFRLWTQATGGSIVWYETQTNVVVSRGVLSVNLGQYQDLGGIQGDNLWVGITVGTDAEMTPRLLLPSQAAPWSFPPGVVVPYFGTNPPLGWLLCDGSVVSRIDYARLFAIIGTCTGAGTNDLTFNLPDLRGMFLRGVNGTLSDTTRWDPDVNLRTNLYTGGNFGNAVGSVQLDDFRSHLHGGGYFATGLELASGGSGARAGGSTSTAYTGGNETRPKNVYVNYIIKY